MSGECGGFNHAYRHGACEFCGAKEPEPPPRFYFCGDCGVLMPNGDKAVCQKCREEEAAHLRLCARFRAEYDDDGGACEAAEHEQCEHDRKEMER